MADEETTVTEETTSDETVTDTTSEETTTEEAKATEETKEPGKTLLSADEGKSDGDALTWTPPEGMELTEEHQAQLTSFTEFGKELGLTQDQFQKLVDFDVKRGQEAATQTFDAFLTRIEGWGDQTRSDPELGGSNINANLAVAKTAMDALVTPEMGAMLAVPSDDNPGGLGLGNHPEVIRLFYRIGQALGEDRLVLGGDAALDNDAARRMYPSMFKDGAA